MTRLVMGSTEEGAETRCGARPRRSWPTRAAATTTTARRRSRSAVATPELAAELWERSEAWTT